MIFAVLISLFIFVGVTISVVYCLDPDLVLDVFKKSPKYNIWDKINLFNDAEWVKKVILSCNTTAQIWNAYTLSEILRKKYEGKVKNRAIWLVSDEISKVFDRQYDKLIYKYEKGNNNISCNENIRR